MRARSGRHSSMSENWEDAAVFVSPDDRNQIKEALEDLVSNPYQVQNLGLRARERAEQFTAERMAGEYMRIYETL